MNDESPKAIKDWANLLLENKNMKLGIERERDRDKLKEQRIKLEGREGKGVDFSVPGTLVSCFVL